MITFKVVYTLMLLLTSRWVLMIIIFLECNYCYLYPPQKHIFLEPKITPIRILYVDIHLIKLITCILELFFGIPHLPLHPHMVGRKKERLKIRYCRNPYLKQNTQGQVYPYVSYSGTTYIGFTHVSNFKYKHVPSFRVPHIHSSEKLLVNYCIVYPLSEYHQKRNILIKVLLCTPLVFYILNQHW